MGNASGGIIGRPGIAIDTKNIINFVRKYGSIYYKKLDGNGNVIIGDVEVSSGWSVANPSIVVDSNNNIHIVWQSEESRSWDIYYRKLDDGGNALTSEIKLYSAGRCNNPSIAVDSSGDIHIVWWDDRNEKSFKPGQVNWEIYYKKLCNDGSALTDDVRITNAKLGSFYPSIAVDTNNNVHVAWYDSRYENSDDWQKCGIYYRKLSP